LNYKIIEGAPYDIHILKTNKFKNVTVRIDFRKCVKKEEITIRNFLISMLTTASKSYETKRLMSIKSEDLFNASISGNSERHGTSIITSFNISVLNDLYTKEGNLEESIAFLSEIIFNPLFNKSAFDIVYEETKNEILSLKDDKTKYAINQMLFHMGEESIISYNNYGYLEDLEKITLESLEEYYNQMIRSDLVDIFVIGDVSYDEIKRIITKYIKINTVKKQLPSIIGEQRKKKKEKPLIIEKENVTQAVLVCGLTLRDLTPFEKEYVLPLYNIILGSGTDSKLFRVIREENSLCYYIDIRSKSLDNISFIYSGISRENYKKTYKLIKELMKDMRLGNFSDEIIENAKYKALSTISIIEDSSSALLDSYFLHKLIKTDTLDVKKKKIPSVTKENIMNVAKKITIDTVFLLQGGDES